MPSDLTIASQYTPHLPSVSPRTVRRRRSETAARTLVPPDAGERAVRLVPHLSLADGLRICLSLADSRSPSFQSAAVRWHSCFCSRASDITLRDALEVLTSLDGLSLGRHAAGEELLGLSLRYQQDETVEVLCGWLRSTYAARPPD